MDQKFTPPEALMLDVYDSTLNNYKFTPYDFRVDNQTGAVDPSYGMYGKNTVDGAGNPIRVWKFNVTRYVQNTLNKREPVHDFRLFTAKGIGELFGPSGGPYTFYSIPINSQFAFGRVRVGGGNHATQRMRLRIIWTKI